MARQLCIEFEDAFYHVMSRGINRQSLFLDADDFKLFLSLLNQAKEKFETVCHSYCLMNNHYHLFIQTPKPNLSQVMHFLNGSYARHFLAKYQEKDGHVFKGRYIRKIVQSNLYSLELSRYIHLNPVRANLVKHPVDWRWSSYKSFIGIAPRNYFLETNWLLRQFSHDLQSAQKSFMEFIQEGIDTDWDIEEHTKAKLVLGSADFFEQIKERYLNTKEINEDFYSHKSFQSKGQDSAEYICKSIDEEISDASLALRLKVFYLRKYTSLSVKEIGFILDRTPNMISKFYGRVKKTILANKELGKLLETK